MKLHLFAQTEDIILGYISVDGASVHNLSSDSRLIIIPISFTVNDIYQNTDIHLEQINMRIDDKGYGNYLSIPSQNSYNIL